MDFEPRECCRPEHPVVAERMAILFAGLSGLASRSHDPPIFPVNFGSLQVGYVALIHPAIQHQQQKQAHSVVGVLQQNSDLIFREYRGFLSGDRNPKVLGLKIPRHASREFGVIAGESRKKGTDRFLVIKGGGISVFAVGDLLL